MATFQIAGTSFNNDASSSTAPLVVLFERDDAIAVPLLSQLRMAGYDVRSSRTPVELFDILGKHLVALVLVDLGCATAGRREFWVALDAQRRGRAIQVMTFRYTPPGSLFDTDFEQTARAIADVEVHGAHEFQIVIDAVRQRIPLHGGANPLMSPGGLGMLGGMGGMNALGAMSMPNAGMPGGIAPIGAALGVPSPFMQPGVMGYGGQAAPFGVPGGIPNSPSMPPQMPYDPAGAGAYNSPAYNPYGANGAYGPNSMPFDQQQMGATYGPMYQQAPGAPQMPPGFGMTPNGANGAPMAYPQAPYPQPNSMPAFGQGGQASQPNAYGFPAAPSSPFAAGYEAASPFAHPVESNPFSAEFEASPFAQPYNMNPFAAETPAAATPPASDFGVPQPQMTPPPAMQMSPFAPAASPPPFAAPFIAPEPASNVQRFDAGDFEQRAAQLSSAYAAQFGIQTPPPGMSPSQPGSDTYGQQGGPAGWGTVAHTPSHSYPGFSGSVGGGVSQNGYGGPRTPEPVSDVWTPPDADMNDLLEGATGVVPEMAFKPIASATHQPEMAFKPMAPATHQSDTSAHPTAPWPSLSSEAVETPLVYHTPAPVSNASEKQEQDLEQATSRLPSPPREQPVYRGSPTEKALSTVLVEGALLDESKMETLQGIQQMLAGVDINFKLGELALLFNFLSPDQLLAAVLVSRGLVTPAQIAGLGRAKQDLAGSGMDYDLETLISMFNILPPDQLNELRDELASIRH